MIELPRAALPAGDDRRGGGVLQLRHQRPDPDHAGRQPRRCRPLPHRLCREGHLRARPVRQHRRRGRRRADRASPPSGAAATRPDLKLGICGEHGGDPASHRLLRGGRPRLRQRLALPRADRPARGGAGGAEGKAVIPDLIRDPWTPPVPDRRRPCSFHQKEWVRTKITKARRHRRERVRSTLIPCREDSRRRLRRPGPFVPS